MCVLFARIFLKLVLVIGDFHIPDRSVCIHPAFKALLSPGKIHHVWCTGNLTNRILYDQLKFICADIHVVKGDFDQVYSLTPPRNCNVL
uniref:Vacuolar protein sorting-associated protein 29 n=1 Tax=Mesocestoides corti TaxID=53468 RepID=A0A5K3FYV7_MESCO